MEVWNCIAFNGLHPIKWQYPVITEKHMYLSLSLHYKNNKSNPKYIYLAVPWATIIDKQLNVQKLVKNITNKQKKYKGVVYITSCQHIYFNKIINILKILKISVYFVCHKLKNQDKINNILIKSIPLYAVNIENSERNMDIIKYLTDSNNNINLINKERKYLYSFIGGYNNSYINKLRPNLFKMKHPINTFVQSTGGWHFEEQVYKEQVRGVKLNNNDKKKMSLNCSKYNQILLQSRYSLCPLGSGPNSIRFWESLALGAIPVLLSDMLELPQLNDLIWSDCIVIIKECDYKKIPQILAQISLSDELKMKENCLKIYAQFSKNNFCSSILSYVNNTINVNYDII